jgi:hypothetical protein
MNIHLVDSTLREGLQSANASVFNNDGDKAKYIDSVSELNIIDRFDIYIYIYEIEDIRQDSKGNAQFLEANLIPSLITNYGSFPKACVINLDLNYEDMIVRIVELGLVAIN